MSTLQPLRVVLCWHMHQPQYQDLVSREHVLPWTYLHAMKDYVDMAVHLESQPNAAAVVNFSPVLLEQIGDYSAQVSAWLRTGERIRDPVLALLTPEGVPAEPVALAAALRACLKANRERMVERFAPFKALAEIAARFLQEDGAAYASRQFIVDLAVWFHLAWLGETVRLGDPRVKVLMERERDFGAEDCRVLLEIIGDILAGLVPRYRRLMGSGQVELSITPYGHPIVPLLLDFRSAREAQPTAELPASGEYPGGDDRASWHIARAVQVFTNAFGVQPRGCWPSEGGVSARTLALLDDFGFDWVASGEAVLHHSLAASQAPEPERHGSLLHRAYRLAGQSVRCFFRHDALSDLIGFTYATWHGDDAATDFVHHLERLAAQYENDPDHVVAVVLDGENAWEYYPHNAFFFLKALYQQLADNPRLKLTTFSQCLVEGIPARELRELVAGSWVYGNFSTWIGHPAKNRAWELLCEAKRAFDRIVVEGALTDDDQLAAERQLGICEGSDWCWWFGGENPSESVRSFDALFRRHLSNLYRILGEEVPAELSQPISVGGGAAELGGVMKRSA